LDRRTDRSIGGDKCPAISRYQLHNGDGVMKNADTALGRATAEWATLLPKMAAFESELNRLGEALLACWEARGKVLTAGNGGSAADAIHLAEELVVRFNKPRRALAAIALCDAGNLTCA